MTGQQRPAPPASPWRRSDFRIAWAAGLVNNTGDWVLLIALPVFVFVETGSGGSTALLFVCQLVAGAALGPIGGSLVDRWNLRRCLIATNLAQAVTVLPLLAVDGERIWPAYLVVVAQAALTQLNDPANVALLPRVVDQDELATANAALTAAVSLARLIGAPLGGVLVAFGGLGPVVLVDAVSFLLVALAVVFIRSDTDPVPSASDQRGGVIDGLRTVRATPPLTTILVVQSVAQLAQGLFVVLFVVFVVQTLGDDGSGLGIIRGAMAIGALVGAAVIAKVATRVEPPLLFAFGLIGMGVVSALFWNAPTVTVALWVYVVLFSLSGIPGSAVTVGVFTTVQTVTPPDTIGRVGGLLGAGDALGVATGSIAAGLLVDRVELELLLNGQALIYVSTGVVTAVLLGRRSTRAADLSRRSR